MILVFGQTGQLARAIAAHAPQARCLGRAEADLTDPAACAQAIRTLRPRAVINAAAYTAVDRAEAEEDLARRINAEAPGAMARACAELRLPFVQVSTDYVFDGRQPGPIAPGAPTAPLNAYGRSKLAGEEQVRAAGGVHLILRTSWVFSGTGQNFLRSMLRAGATRDQVSVVDDQIGGPTPAEALAAACLSIADQLTRAPHKSGTCHFAGAPEVSWAGFARAIFAAAGLPCAVRPIASADWPTQALRPANSVLDCSDTLHRFGLPRPDWRASLPAAIRQHESTPAA